jgi:Uma2 family endonuclease
MDRVIFRSISLERFLRLPEAKPALEYIDGEVIQKVSPKQTHSVMQAELLVEMMQFARRGRLGRAYPELRCTIGGNSLVPDVCFIASDRVPRDEDGQLVDDITIPPDLWVEIISPGQTVRSMSARLLWCLGQGVRLGWLVQPRRERVYVFEPGAAHRVLGRGDDLDGGAVLPGFRMALAGLFDELKRP